MREQLSSFRALHVLAMVMTRNSDEGAILRLAMSSVPSFSDCHARGVYVDGHFISSGRDQKAWDAELEAQIVSVGPGGGRLSIQGTAWAWGFPLTSLEGVSGHLVISADEEPPDHDQFVLSVLAQQAGVSLANARLHARERATADQLRTANLALEDSMGALQQSITIHERLTDIALAGQGREGIAAAVHELTGLPVAVEDRYGNLGAWAGPGRPEPYPKKPIRQREAMLTRALRSSHAVRQRDRLLALARVGEEVMGVIALIDPGGTASEADQVAVEHGATVLALELAHLRNLAESELRLRRDLVEELLVGTNSESVLNRADAIGYDLGRPHRVLVVEGHAPPGRSEGLFHAVRRAARDERVGTLLVERAEGVVVLSDADQDWEAFRHRIVDELGGGMCRIGVGCACATPAQFPTSQRQARLALKMQRQSAGRGQVTVFEELGVYRVLSEVPDSASIEGFVRQWLGLLIDYDARKGSELVTTLSAFLECGGSYDATSAALSLHRSTLRYRLQRLREVSGHDTTDPDTRFNLQLATRAWQTLQAMRE
ncbi:MAG: hypothetical protein QOH61_2032 [Chloroflexota bacterium]|nr:hypothetical protein [Chloroflexota bacterium]